MATKSTPPRDPLALPLIGQFVLILLGMVLCLDFVPELRARLLYVEGRCVVLDRQLVSYPRHRTRPNDNDYRPEFLIRYTVAGREYTNWAYEAVVATTGTRESNGPILERFAVGQEIPCWYNPADPNQVVVVRGFSWLTCVALPMFVMVAFLTGKGFYACAKGAKHTGL